MDAAIAVVRCSEPSHDDEVFVNTSPPWQQPGAQGAFGGAIMARCLMAAQGTVSPASEFLPHSLQCIFIRGAKISSPMTYHVDRLRDGKGFSSRRVRVQQQGLVVMEALISYGSQEEMATATSTRTDISTQARKRSLHLNHQPSLPPPLQSSLSDQKAIRHQLQTQKLQNGLSQPFHVLDLPSPPGSHPAQRKMYRWMRAKPTRPPQNISRTASHLAALVLMSDHRFIGAAVRAHRLPRFSAPAYIPRVLRNHRAETLNNSSTTTKKDNKRLNCANISSSSPLRKPKRIHSSQPSSTSPSPKLLVYHLAQNARQRTYRFTQQSRSRTRSSSIALLP
jgi:acyl-CoA thioesterase II